VTGDQTLTTVTSTYKFRHLREGDHVLVKEATLSGMEKGSHRFLLSSQSNILSIPKDASLYI
jgi:hypothetical protein